MWGYSSNLVPRPVFRLTGMGRALSVARRRADQGARSVLRCRRGVAAVEFAIIAPVFLLLTFGLLKVGLTVSDYIQLTAAAEQGAETLALTRGTTGPYTAASNAINSAAGSLTTGSITKTMTVNGAACTSGTCTVSTAGQVAAVTLTYPCDLTIMGTNYGGTVCTISASAAAVVQ